MTLQVGIAGAGFITSFKHLPAFSKVGDLARVVALADPDQEVVRQTASRFAVPHVYADVDAMLSDESLDVIAICTPPRTHAAVAMKAIATGCNVLIEKPMALSVDECDQIIDAADEIGVKVCVAHSDLFYPPFLKARRLVAQGSIGEFRGMRIFLSTASSYMTADQEHWANRLPGGVIAESGPHAVYMTLAFINPIHEARIHASKLLPYEWSQYDDYRIDLIGETGTSSIALVYTSDQWAAEVDIWGSEGLLKLDLQLMSLIRQHRPSVPRQPPSKRVLASSGVRASVSLLRDVVRASGLALSRKYRTTHDILIEGFLRSIVSGSPPPVTAEEGREAVRVMTMIVDQLGSSPRSSSAQ